MVRFWIEGGLAVTAGEEGATGATGDGRSPARAGRSMSAAPNIAVPPERAPAPGLEPGAVGGFAARGTDGAVGVVGRTTTRGGGGGPGGFAGATVAAGAAAAGFFTTNE
jgi:hypothetical protein